MSTFETTDVGRLTLHRLGHVEGLTISATSAMAPKDAQKAFAKGRDKAGKQKWDEAQPLLEKAVEIYPKYAEAWFELGRVQLVKKDDVQARKSFDQSIAADPQFVHPYRGLAELDTKQEQWPALVSVTDQLLALNPVNFPDAWFRNALGNYYMQNFPAAEKSARQGNESGRQPPVSEDGILARRRSDAGASVSGSRYPYPELSPCNHPACRNSRRAEAIGRDHQALGVGDRPR